MMNNQSLHFLQSSHIEKKWKPYNVSTLPDSLLGKPNLPEYDLWSITVKITFYSMFEIVKNNSLILSLLAEKITPTLGYAFLKYSILFVSKNHPYGLKLWFTN